MEQTPITEKARPRLYNVYKDGVKVTVTPITESEAQNVKQYLTESNQGSEIKVLEVLCG